MKYRTTNAFSLVELLVVIAIIGVLLAILIPAVQAVREGARRTACRENNRQICLAVLNYESGHETFPIGVMVPNNVPGTSPDELFGWGTAILAFLEQGGREAILNPSPTVSILDRATDPTDGSKVIELLQSPMSIFLCPSDSAEPLNRYRPASTQIEFMATSNYVAANSTSLVHALRDPVTRRAPDGAFNGFEAMTFSGIEDGSSNTILFSERMYHTVRRGANKEIAGGALQYGCRGIGGANDTHFACAGRINFFDANNDRDLADYGASSSHSGGVVVSLADGSNHFILDSIDSYYTDNPAEQSAPDDSAKFGVWERAIAVADGQTVNILE